MLRARIRLSLALSLVFAITLPSGSEAYVWELEAPGARTNDCYQSEQLGELLAAGQPFETYFPTNGRGLIVRGRIEPTPDPSPIYESDCFLFYAAAGDRITAHVINDGGSAQFDPALELWEPLRYPWIEESDDDGPGRAAALDSVAEKSGIWKVRVRGPRPVPAIGKPDGIRNSFEYFLVVSVSRTGDPAIAEGAAENGSQPVAEPLPTGASGASGFAVQAPGLVAVKVGRLDDLSDVDVYRAQIPPSEWVSAAVYDEFGGLREDLGLTVVTSGATHVDEDSGPFLEPQVQTGPASGDVFFTVRRAAVPELDWLGVHEDVRYWLVVAIQPEEDRDGDGVLDAVDNCPHITNAAQLDQGGIGSGSAPDGIGDACQCGDVNGDGRVTIVDSVTIARSLLQPPTVTRARPELCDVGGGASPATEDCTLSDAVIIRRALLVPATAGTQQVCPATR